METRRDWRIKPWIWFDIDKDEFLLALIPTVLIQPWRHRWPMSSVIEIHWLMFHVGIGRWVRK